VNPKKKIKIKKSHLDLGISPHHDEFKICCILVAAGSCRHAK